MPSPCHPSIQNFFVNNCTTACQLQFTVCAKTQPTGEDKCITSQIEHSGFPNILFSELSLLFPDESLELLLDFQLSATLQNVSF